MIYFNSSKILFHLNTVLNGHSDLLKIHEVNYLIQPLSGKIFIVIDEIAKDIENFTR